ncbi:MAG TPA: hypothetical protein EYQ29_13530, partial [Candidatus Lambdaproteobacteria bacterium]|nr:hypothetical protein [Candidatus Lambdaproteobacteria bacterium]
MIQRFLMLLGLLASLLLGGTTGWATPQNDASRLSQPFASGVWEQILDLYRNDRHEETLEQLRVLLNAPNLEPIMKRRAWLLAGKSALALNRPQEARVFFEEVNDPKLEDFDLWLYYRIKAHLVAGEHSRAIYLLQLLLDHPANSYYLTRIQQDLLEHFRTTAERRLLFPLLEYATLHPRMLFRNFQVYQQYVEASKLHGVEVPFEIHLLAWQYPKDEESAKQVNRILAKHKRRNVPGKAVLNRVHRLAGLKLNRYLMQHLPKLAKGRKFKVRRKLGEVYVQILLDKRYFSKLLKLQQQDVLAQLYGFSKPEQLYWVMQANHGLDRTLPARSAVYQLERANKKSWLLPNAYQRMALHYMQKGDRKKAGFWWRRLVQRFPEHNHAPEAYWKLAWYHYDQG